MNEQLKQITNAVTRRFDPEKLILFGSVARRNEVGEDSDVDLIVIIDTEEDLFDVAARIRGELRKFPYAFDILVRTPEMFEKEKSAYWTVFSEAEKEGFEPVEGKTPEKFKTDILTESGTVIHAVEPLGSLEDKEEEVPEIG